MLDYPAPPRLNGRSLVLLKFDAPHFLCKSRGSSSFLNGEWKTSGWGGGEVGKRKGWEERRKGEWLVCKINRKNLFK